MRRGAAQHGRHRGDVERGHRIGAALEHRHAAIAEVARNFLAVLADDQRRAQDLLPLLGLRRPPPDMALHVEILDRGRHVDRPGIERGRIDRRKQLQQRHRVARGSDVEIAVEIRHAVAIRVRRIAEAVAGDRAKIRERQPAPGLPALGLRRLRRPRLRGNARLMIDVVGHPGLRKTGDGEGRGPYSPSRVATGMGSREACRANVRRRREKRHQLRDLLSRVY